MANKKTAHRLFTHWLIKNPDYISAAGALQCPSHMAQVLADTASPTKAGPRAKPGSRATTSDPWYVHNRPHSWQQYQIV